MRSTKQSGNEVRVGTAYQSVSSHRKNIYFCIYETWQDKEWFAGDCNRKTAEELLTRVNKVNQHIPLQYFLLSKSPKPPFSVRAFAVAGRCFSHPTQLGPDRPPAVHPSCALPREGLQHSRPLPGGNAGLRSRKRGQEERGGER